MDKIFRGIANWFSCNQFREQFWACLIAGVATLLPLILQVDLYIDDIERSMNGRLNWIRVGRPLADMLFEALNFGRPATAVAPLFTLLAIALLSLAGIACARAYGIRSPFWVAVASLPLMAQPYGLQAMSYGFDSLSMAMALLLSVLAALLMHCRRDWRCWLGALLLQLASFNLYQPAANSFLVISGFLCIGAALELLDLPWRGPSLRMRVVLSAGVYGIGYGLYRVVNSLLFEHYLNGYAISAAELIPFNQDLPMAMLDAATEPMQLVWQDFGASPVVMPLIFLVITYMALLVLRCSWRSAAIVTATAVVVVLLAPGGMLLLSNSFARHPRVMMYLGPVLTSLIFQILVISRLEGCKVWRLGVFPLIWLMVVFSYSFGHAFAGQARFEQGRLSRIVGAASTLQAQVPEQPIRYLLVAGTMPRSPVLQNTVRKFPLVDRLIPPLLDGNQTFSFSQLQLHGLELMKRRPDELKDLMSQGCVPSVRAICTGEFSLQRDGGDTLVLQLAPEIGSRRPRT